jgi:hypothetical protein
MSTNRRHHVLERVHNLAAAELLEENKQANDRRDSNQHYAQVELTQVNERVKIKLQYFRLGSRINQVL